MKRCPMNGSLDNKSLRTLGTSPKKKMAKMPAVAPKAPRVIPLVELLVFCPEYLTPLRQSVWINTRKGHQGSRIGVVDGLAALFQEGRW